MDCFVKFSVTEPDFRITLVELFNRGSEMLPSCADSSLRQIVISDDPFDTGSLPWLITLIIRETALNISYSFFKSFRILGIVTDLEFEGLIL